MTNPPPLVDRIRAALSDRQHVREVRMFGALCFMVNEKMVVGTMKDDSLLVRVDPDRGLELLKRPGARESEMGKGRLMGTGWIRVAPEVAADELPFWLAEALAFNAQLVP